MSDVPSDLVREILVNLPAKSLFRFRSVSKEWLCKIDDSSFIKAHANNQIYNHSLVVGDNSWAPLHSFCLDSLNFITNGSQMVDATPIKNSIPRSRNLSTSVFPCNGLIMFTAKVADDIDRLVIRNPLTKESHNLPKPYNIDDLNEYGYAYGFGYDSGSDDYKVVRIDDLSYSQEKVVFQTLVYSLKSNSWRTVEDPPCRVHLKGSLLDGALYWISGVNDWKVVSFDLGTERYCQLPLPSVRDHCFDLGLNALDGCLIFSFNSKETKTFDGWVMKDDGVEKSWIKLFSLQYTLLIIAHPPLIRLVAYLKTKQQVVLHNLENLNCFLWFDVANNSIKKFSIHGRRIASSLICPGSLVRLSHYRGGDTTSLPRKMKKKKTKTQKTNTRYKYSYILAFLLRMIYEVDGLAFLIICDDL